ncbi:hypothetical protein GW777_01235 [Candidatus Peregrinibacteria bacterium]|nr:hypothetical protein [Candidatus Peregrinibacteria bacterium]
MVPKMINNFDFLFGFLFNNSLFFWALVLCAITFFVLILVRLFVWFEWQRPYIWFWNQTFKEPEKSALSPSLKKALIVIILSVVCFIFWGRIGLVSALLFGLLLLMILKFKGTTDDKKQLEKQLPTFMRALGSTLKAGYSVPQALEFVSLETVNPLKNKLKEGHRLLLIQQPLNLVLNDWRDKVKVPEFNFLTDSLQLQVSSGGNLVQSCYAVAKMLDERVKLEQDIRSFTAQGKMSGFLMALLWPISLALFAWLSPSHVEVLFRTTAGQILLSFSFLLELLGFYFIWRLIRLKI